MPKTLFICHFLGLIVWCFLTFKELETLNSQSTQRLKINLENMAIKKIWRLLNSELIKAILSKDPWLKGLAPNKGALAIPNALIHVTTM